LEGRVGAEEVELVGEFSGGREGEEELAIDVVDGYGAAGFGELEERVRADGGVSVCFDPRAGGLHQGEFGSGTSWPLEYE
jgi:hypothetical protein